MVIRRTFGGEACGWTVTKVIASTEGTVKHRATKERRKKCFFSVSPFLCVIPLPPSTPFPRRREGAPCVRLHRLRLLAVAKHRVEPRGERVAFRRRRDPH